MSNLNRTVGFHFLVEWRDDQHTKQFPEDFFLVQGEFLWSISSKTIEKMRKYSIYLSNMIGGEFNEIFFISG